MEAIIQYAASQYGFDAGRVEFVSDSTNKIYRFSKDGNWYILRIAQQSCAHFEETLAEIDWLGYLARHGVPVSLPLESENGQLVLMTESEGSSYILSAYEMAEGSNWDRETPSLWNERIFFHWGKTMGKMHRLTNSYQPSGNIAKRGSFHGHEVLFDSYRAFPDVKLAADRIINEIMQLPREPGSYGLIHYDLHPWNFLIRGEEISVYDFDDCLYGWYALDIAVALFHGLWWGCPSNMTMTAFSEWLIGSFMDGYASEYTLHEEWLVRIPLFMRYRQVCRFSWFHHPGITIGPEQQHEIDNIKQGVLFDNLQLDLFVP